MPLPACRQVAVVPWRPGNKEPEVLLISGRHPPSPAASVWVLPQGGVEPGQTPAEAAAAEAWEEAGVEGTLESSPFTTYRYESGSGRCHVDVFRMRVAHEASHWPEQRERSRRWLSWRASVSAISGNALREVLARFHSGRFPYPRA